MTDRHLELSGKFIEMGQALVKEGKEKSDYKITQSGTFFTLIGGLMYDEKDVSLFAELCSMFSAKKVLENMENDMDMVKDIGLNTKHNYEDLINRINKLREESEDDISDEEKDEEDED
jgi:hypothetical protein